jgi:hypothetical protein
MATLGFRKGPARGNHILRGTVAVDPASIAAGAAGSTVITIAGVKSTDIVVLEPPAALEAGLYPKGVIPGNGSVTLILGNPTAGAVDGASRTWTYKIYRSV